MKTIDLFLEPGSVVSVLKVIAFTFAQEKLHTCISNTHFQHILAKSWRGLQQAQAERNSFKYKFIFKLKSVALFSDFFCILFLSENMWKYGAMCIDCKLVCMRKRRTPIIRIPWYLSQYHG